MKNIGPLEILNKKEFERIIESIKDRFGINELKELTENYGFLISNNNRVYIVSRDISNIDISKLNMNSIGMYFCDINEDVILSIEGTQLIGNKATKNIIELDEEQMKEWLLGRDIEISENHEGSVILKYKEDFLGCGQIKENKILNFVAKNRRIKEEVFV